MSNKNIQVLDGRKEYYYKKSREFRSSGMGAFLKSLSRDVGDVYDVLCCYANWNTSSCELSYSRIQKETGIKSHSTIKKCLGFLEEYGLISTKQHFDDRGMKSTSEYWVLDSEEWVIPARSTWDVVRSPRGKNIKASEGASGSTSDVDIIESDLIGKDSKKKSQSGAGKPHGEKSVSPQSEKPPAKKASTSKKKSKAKKRKRKSDPKEPKQHGPDLFMERVMYTHYRLRRCEDGYYRYNGKGDPVEVSNEFGRCNKYISEWKSKGLSEEDFKVYWKAWKQVYPNATHHGAGIDAAVWYGAHRAKSVDTDGPRNLNVKPAIPTSYTPEEIEKTRRIGEQIKAEIAAKKEGRNAA